MTRLGRVLVLIFAVLIGGFVLLVVRGSRQEQPAAPPAPRVAKAEPRPSGLLVPVSGVTASELEDSFTDERGGGVRAHGALDIMAPRGTPVVAAAPGVVEKLFDSHDGGRTVYIRSPDGRTIFYYAHLDRYAPGLREGLYLTAGAPIGAVGSSGNADPAGPHLHFEVKQVEPRDGWYARGRVLNPYLLLTRQSASLAR